MKPVNTAVLLAEASNEKVRTYVAARSKAATLLTLTEAALTPLYANVDVSAHSKSPRIVWHSNRAELRYGGGGAEWGNVHIKIAENSLTVRVWLGRNNNPRHTNLGIVKVHTYREQQNRSVDFVVTQPSHLDGPLTFIADNEIPGWLRAGEHEARSLHEVDQPRTVFSDPDVTDERTFIEGKLVVAQVNRFERDRGAREECVKQLGVRCKVCQMTFKERYGEFAEGFIHVHHLKLLSEIRENYVVAPTIDLVPVCPNCHAMLHKSGLSPEELRASMSLDLAQ